MLVMGVGNSEPKDNENMTPPKSLTDSQKELAAVVEGVIAGQTPRPSDSATMFEVAETVVKRSRPEHMIECEERGPACKLGKKIEKMEAKIDAHEQIIREFVGAQKLSRWLVPIVTALATSGLVVGMVKLMWSGAMK
jgi:hypothetical protein